MIAIHNRYNGATDFVELELGEAFVTVKEVRDNLPGLERLIENLQLLNLDIAGVLSGYSTRLNVIEADLVTIKANFNTSSSTNSSRFGAIESSITSEISTRTTQYSAMASSITTILSRVDSAEAAIIEESSTRVTNELATASVITSLTSRVAASEASIVNESTTRSTAISALAQRVESLNASIGDTVSALVRNETVARATADSALASQITTLAVAVEDNTAAIETISTTGVTDGSALASQVTTLTANVSANTAAITAANTARVSGDNALATQISTLTTTVNGNTAAINTANTARADGDSVLASQISSLTTTVDNNTTAINTANTVRADADTALATRATNLESTVNHGTTGNAALVSRIATEESTRASADGALATRSSVLESAVRFPIPETINKNSTFITWTGTSGTIPEDWLDWNQGALNTKVTGSISPNAYRQSNAAGVVNRGLYYTLNGSLTLGWYVIECDVTLNSGSLVGASLHFNWGVTVLTDGATLSLSSDPDISGNVIGVGVTGRRYRFSKLVNIPLVPNLSNFYMMTNWEAIASSANAKDITWHKAGVRAATQGEIDAKVVRDTTLPATVARIAAEETTRAGETGALAARSSNLEATVNHAATGNTALQSRIAAEETARVAGDSAIATRTTTLEAVSGISPDALNVNSDFKVWTDNTSLPNNWAWWDSNGPIARNPGVNGRPYAAGFNPPDGGNAGILQDLHDLSFGAYIIEFVGRATTWQGAGVTVQFFDAAWSYKGNVQINASTTADTSGYISSDGGGGAYTRTWSVFYQTPIDGTYRRARIIAMANWSGFGTGVAKSISFDKVSIRPATASEIAAQRADTNATTALANISTESTARANADTALSSSISSLTTTVGGNTASISSQSSSINGLLLKNGVKLNSNGHITGFEQNNNGTTGSFTVVADQFSVVTPAGSGSATPFSVTGAGVRIDGNLAVSGSITSDGLAPNAASTPVFAYSAIGLTMSGWTTVQSLTITVTGQPVAISFGFWQGLTGSGGNFKLQRTLSGGSTHEIIPSATIGGGWFSFSIGDLPAAGTYTYAVLATTSSLQTFHRSLFVQEIKR